MRWEEGGTERSLRKKAVCAVRSNGPVGKQLVRVVAKATGLRQFEVAKVLYTLHEAIIHLSLNGDDVPVPGLGRWVMQKGDRGLSPGEAYLTFRRHSTLRDKTVGLKDFKVLNPLTGEPLGPA